MVTAPGQMMAPLSQLTPSEACFAVVRHFEGCYLKSYYCEGGKLTIGYGHTNDDPSMRVYPGQTITKVQAEQLLRADLPAYAQKVKRYLPQNLMLTQGQFDALVSYAYNCGPGKLKTSDFGRAIQAGDLGSAASLLPSSVITAKGRPLEGLKRRRRAEQALFINGQATDGNGNSVGGNVFQNIGQGIQQGLQWFSQQAQNVGQKINNGEFNINDLYASVNPEIPLKTNANPLYAAYQKYIGVRYKFGEKNPNTGRIDCSGFVRRIFGDNGCNLEDGSQNQAIDAAAKAGTSGTLKNTTCGRVRESDIPDHAVLTIGIKKYGHVVVVTKNDRGERVVLQSSSGTGVHETSLASWIAWANAEGNRGLQIADVNPLVAQMQQNSQQNPQQNFGFQLASYTPDRSAPRLASRGSVARGRYRQKSVKHLDGNDGKKTSKLARQVKVEGRISMHPEPDPKKFIGPYLPGKEPVGFKKSATKQAGRVAPRAQNKTAVPKSHNTKTHAPAHKAHHTPHHPVPHH